MKKAIIIGLILLISILVGCTQPDPVETFSKSCRTGCIKSLNLALQNPDIDLEDIDMLKKVNENCEEYCMFEFPRIFED